MGGVGAKLVFWSIRLGMMGVRGRARAVSEKTFLFERGGEEGFIGECTSRLQNPMERGKTILPMKKRRKSFFASLCNCEICAEKKNISPKIAGKLPYMLNILPLTPL